ncbi:endonuclease VII domain-containing protein [Actinomadura sp. WMMB 499]|uniref:endonuclease VII domain-containing protein n=1 Tax=Actinomadura sp. WMMB 499 TaxID=1219491 RepID=UPI0020C8035F|nr:endonuclease VII domain-containing protein [Actinomadura sp. WMMB 499]
MRTYGLGPGEYDKLFEAQGGVCAGCRQPRRERLSVDHCHTTQLVRGLLCRRCNGHILPYSKDSPEVLRRLADYLEHPPAVAILGERYYQGDGTPKPQRKRRRRK